MTVFTSLTASSNLTFDDEFNTFTSSPNGDVGWMTSYPYGGESARALPGNGEAEYYSDSSVGTNPFHVSNGVLDITATRAAAGSNPYNLPYTSGLITTYKSFAQTYGFFEIRAELPAGQGLWPAFWLLPDTVVYQSELDVFEALEGVPTTVYASTHSDVNGVKTSDTQALQVANTTTGFHTYGVDWEPTTVTFYIDGKAVATAPTPAAMDKPMYMLANLAVGTASSWPGAPNASTKFPATMQIDWVRAYATANTIQVTGTVAIKSAAIGGVVALSGIGISGAGVALLNAAGTVIATATTGSGGKFRFASLAAGDYRIRYTAPSGQSLLKGGEANATTGLTATVVLSAGQAMTLPSEALTPPGKTAATANIQSKVLHFGAATDPAWGGGDAGVTVALLNTSGSVLATTVTSSNGWYIFRNLSAGTYQVRATPPAGQTVEPGHSALISSIVVAAGATVLPATIDMISTATLASSSGVSDGLVNSAGMAVAATDGTGISFLNGDGAEGQVFLLDASGSGIVTAINDFSVTAHDVLDLNQSLAGTDILATLSNVTDFITAHATGANTTLYVDPTAGGGTPHAFAVLEGIHTTMADLLADQELSLG